MSPAWARCFLFAKLLPMAELFRDTAFGHLVRLISGKKFLKFAEEEDPSIWTRYIDEKKSGYLAHHGDTSPPENGSELEGIGGVRTREDQLSLFPPARLWSTERRGLYHSRSYTEDGNAQINNASGVKVDPEKGKDLHLVSWYGDNDPENVSNMFCTNTKLSY